MKSVDLPTRTTDRTRSIKASLTAIRSKLRFLSRAVPRARGGPSHRASGSGAWMWSANLPPKVALISYSYDSEPHKAWVIQLATDLRKRYGIDALLDVWEVPPGGDLSKFMQQGSSRSDRVLMICTEQYVTRANDGTGGGVPYEMMIVRQAIVGSIDTIKFIPVIRDQLGPIKIPDGIGLRMAIDFRDDAEYPAKLEQLARAVNGLGLEKPALGANPFVGP